MRHQLLIIIILAIVANFIFLSIGFSQDKGVQLQGIVPLTDKNIDQTFKSRLNSQMAKQPTTKENKYLQFFDKGLEIEEKEKELALLSSKNQTIHDRFASYGLMIFVLVIVAALLIFILRGIDTLILKH